MSRIPVNSGIEARILKNIYYKCAPIHYLLTEVVIDVTEES